MRYSSVAICALLFATTVGCQTTEDANDKISRCIEDEYGEAAVDEKLPDVEVKCADGEDGCDECVDCVMDEKCDALLDGVCRETCQ